MKTILLFLIFSTTLFAKECPKTLLPNDFILQEKFWTIGTDFEVTHQNKNLGKVVERVLNWGTTFEFYNEKEELLAKGKKVVFSLGTKLEIFDCNNILIGIIEEEVFESLFSWSTKYIIKDAKGSEVARSEKNKLTVTHFELFVKGEQVASMTRPWLSLKDKWTVSYKESLLDPRFMVMIGAFKTDSDNQKSSSSSSSKNK